MAVRVGMGLADMPFEGPDGFWNWIDMCETGGVDSIWQTDRLISDDPMLECMSVMAALAGGTKRLKFGMNVVSVALRDPLLLAKQCATVDFLSSGRILPAFGIGSNFSPEWKATSMPTKGWRSFPACGPKRVSTSMALTISTKTRGLTLDHCSSRCRCG